MALWIIKEIKAEIKGDATQGDRMIAHFLFS
jgi:hypothetical protein